MGQLMSTCVSSKQESLLSYEVAQLVTLSPEEDVMSAILGVDTIKIWRTKRYEEQLAKIKGDNRKEEKTFMAAKNTCNIKDLSRMRSILGQLKQSPKPVSAI
jgi:hypothetical protein